MVGRGENGKTLGKTELGTVFDDITFDKQTEGERSVRFLLGGQRGSEEDGGVGGGGDGGGGGGGGGKDKRFLSRLRSPPATARQVCQKYMSLIRIYLLCSMFMSYAFVESRALNI